MKKAIYFLAFLILFYNCSNNEEIIDNPNNSIEKGKGSFTLNSNTKPINYAYINFFSGGATFSLKNVELNNQNQVYSDTSETVWFDIRPQQNNNITEGTYRFSSSGQVSPYIQDGGHFTQNGNTIDEFTDGTLTIIKVNGEYEVSFDLNLFIGKSITGNYKGKINIVE